MYNTNNILVRRPGSSPLGGLRVWSGFQNSFLEFGHVAYQIIGNGTCSNMVANTLPVDTPLTPGMRSKGQDIFFSESSHIEYQMKGNGA